MHQVNTPPAAHKRVTVPVSPDVLAAFQLLASVTGVSTGKAMGDWLADTLDAVSMMTGLLQKAKQAPRLAALEIQAYGRGITGLAEDIIEDIRSSSSVDGAKNGGGPACGEEPGVAPSSLSDVLSGIKERGGPSGRGDIPLSPPLSNTGGKVPKNGKKPSSRQDGGGGEK